MSLADLFIEPAPIDGRFARFVSPLGPMPEPMKPTPAQLAHLRAMRRLQVGKPKSRNRVKR